jgi:hypothetical protein
MSHSASPIRSRFSRQLESWDSPHRNALSWKMFPRESAPGKAAKATVIAFRTTVEEAGLRSAGADFVLNNCADISAARNGAGLILRLTDTGARSQA